MCFRLLSFPPVTKRLHAQSSTQSSISLQQIRTPSRVQICSLCSQSNLILKRPWRPVSYNTVSLRNNCVEFVSFNEIYSNWKTGSVAPPVLFIPTRFICIGETITELFVSVKHKTFYELNLNLLKTRFGRQTIIRLPTYV